MSTDISYGVAKTKEDLLQILHLQSENLPSNLSIIEAKSEGFVTLKHDLDLLTKMNHDYPHVIAKYEKQVVGYALIMLRKFSNEIPPLFPMFECLQNINYNGEPISDQRFFIMGQVCVKKEFRGRGILESMYDELRQRMKNDFDYMITLISTKNQRSIRAHSKFGFEEIHSFESDKGESLSIVFLKLHH